MSLLPFVFAEPQSPAPVGPELVLPPVPSVDTLIPAPVVVPELLANPAPGVVASPFVPANPINAFRGPIDFTCPQGMSLSRIQVSGSCFSLSCPSLHPVQTQTNLSPP